jgi:hypothetical protein
MGQISLKFACILLVAGSVACAGRETEEARAFLSAYEAIDHRDPEPVRAPRVEALAKLVLTSPKVQKTRDECVKAHRLLLDAEGAQERAASALEEAVRGTPGAEPMAPARTFAIQSVISAAERALAEARQRFTTCEQEARDLSLRYGRR